MKRLIAVLACMTIGACVKSSIGRESTNNKDIAISKLFDKDGCTMYRFYDMEYRYFVICPTGHEATTSGEFSRQSGKTTETVPDQIETRERP